MDQGHGLIDRFLIATPLAFRPTMSEMETTQEKLTTEVVSDFDEFFLRVSSLDENTVYSFDSNGKRLLRETMDIFVGEVNEAIKVIPLFCIAHALLRTILKLAPISSPISSPEPLFLTAHARRKNLALEKSNISCFVIGS
ncbi:hypothetical protein QZH41_003203 [Actinostola sp. cb2023]|nr:hypothetical protein QZH41_003203 [Actinostola sp. cb2023]